MIRDNVVIENARLILKNFSGEERQYNAAGKRNFCVILNDDLADKLLADGWNVKWPKIRDDADDMDTPNAYLPVEVSYKNIPPKIVVISSRGKNILDENTVSRLDWAELSTVDLIIRPYNWEMSGRSGVKAYVKAMYATLEEDEFEKKYYTVPDMDDGD